MKYCTDGNLLNLQQTPLPFKGVFKGGKQKLFEEMICLTVCITAHVAIHIKRSPGIHTPDNPSEEASSAHLPPFQHVSNCFWQAALVTKAWNLSSSVGWWCPGEMGALQEAVCLRCDCQRRMKQCHVSLSFRSHLWADTPDWMSVAVQLLATHNKWIFAGVSTHPFCSGNNT